MEFFPKSQRMFENQAEEDKIEIDWIEKAVKQRA